MQHPAFRIESSLVVSSESEYNITKTNTLIKDRKEIMKGMKPIKIYSCADRIQADMIVEALNENGIPAYTESQGSGGPQIQACPSPQKPPKAFLSSPWPFPEGMPARTNLRRCRPSGRAPEIP